MSTKQEIKIAVGVENHVGAGLKSALTEITKWNAEATRKLILGVTVSGNDAIKQSADMWMNSLSKIRRGMKNFNFEGLFYSPKKKTSKETKISFSEDFIKDLDYNSALTTLKQLKDLRERINSKHATSSTWTAKQNNELRDLIALLEQSTGAYKTLKIEEGRQITQAAKAKKKAEEKALKDQKKALEANQKADDNYQRKRYKMALEEQEKEEKAELARAKRARNSDYASSSREMARMRAFYESGWDRNKASSVLQNKRDLQQAFINRKNAQLTGDLEAEIRANRELIPLLRKKASLTNNAYSYEQIRQIKQRNQELAQEVKTQREQKKTQDKLNAQYHKQGFLFRQLTSLARRYFNIFMFKNIIEQMAKMTGYFQQQQVALEGILGSASKARSVMESAKKLALNSPFTTEQIVGNVKQIAAYGIEPDALVPTAKMLGDLSAGLGVDMNRLILAYGQVKSASVLRGQELRQFTEAGVPMVQKLADKFTKLNGELVTTGDVFELISKRQVSFEMVSSVLKDMTSEGGAFYNMQENVMDTLYGQIGKLKDVWTLSLNDMGSSIGKTLMNAVKGLQFAIKNFPFVLVTGFLTAVGNQISALIFRVRTLRAEAKALEATMMLKNIGINAAIAAGSALIGLLANAMVKADEFRKKMNQLEEGFTKDTAKSVNGLNSLIGKLREFPETSKSYKDALDTLLTNYKDYIDEESIKRLELQNKDLDEQRKAWEGIAENIQLAIEAKAEFEKHRGAQQLAGESAVSRYSSDLNKKIIEVLEGEAYARNGRNISGYKKDLEAIYKTFRDKNVGFTIEGALTSFYNNGYTEEADLVKLLKSQARSYGLTEEATNVLAQNAKTILKVLEGTEEWQRYLLETNAIANDPHTIIGRNLSSASSEIANEGLGLKESDIRYMEKAYKALKEIGLTSKDVADVIGRDWNAESTHKFAEALHDLAETLDDKRLKENVNHLKNQFVEMAGTRTGAAAQITSTLQNNGFFDEATKDYMRQKGYDRPTDATVESLRQQIKSTYDDNKKEIESHPNPQGAWLDTVNKLKAENGILQTLAAIYDIDLSKKTGSGSNHTEKMNGALGLFTKMYDRIKAAKDAQKQLVEGSAGFTNELKNQISTLETSPLRYFYGETQGNPFADIVSDLQKLGLKIKGLDLSKLNAVATDVTTAGFANFEGTWAALTEALKTIADGIKDPELKNRLISYIEGKDLDGEKLFGIDEVKGKIDEAIRSLTKIEKETKRISEKNDLVESLGEKVGYEAASQAILGQSYGFHDRAGAAKKAIEDMLAATGGAGVNAQFGERIRALFAKGTLGLNSIPTILELIDDMNKFAEEIKVGDDGKTLGTFEMMKEAIAVAVGQLENLNEGIKDVALTMAAYESIEDQAATELKNAVAIYKKANAVVESESFDKDKQLARTTAANNMYDAMLNVFGATASPDWVKHMYMTNKDGVITANRDGVMSGLVGMSFKDQSIYAKVEEYLNKIANGETVDEDAFSKEVRDLADGIDKAAAIVKKIGSTLQNVSEVLNGLYDLIDATDGVYNKGGVYYNGNTTSARQITNTFTDLGSGIVGMAESFLNGDLGSVAAKAITTLFTLIKNIAGVQDSIKQDKIDELALDNAILEKKRSELEWLDTFNAGYEKIVNSMERANTLEAESLKYKQMEMLEASKKNADADKANEFANKSLETHREAVRMLQEVQNSILSTADSVANTLSNALVNAFRNGTNAARAWRDAVKSYIGDALANMLITQMLAPQLQDLMNEYMFGRDNHGKVLNAETAKDYYGSWDAAQKKAWERMSDPAHVEKFGKDLNQLGTNWIDQFEGFSQIIKDYIGFNPSSSSLSGGIQSITEDTARRMEALSNSQLGELYHIRQAVDSIMRNGAGQTQMATLQSNIASINSNVALMYALMQNVTRGINKFHVTMS